VVVKLCVLRLDALVFFGVSWGLCACALGVWGGEGGGVGGGGGGGARKRPRVRGAR